MEKIKAIKDTYTDELKGICMLEVKNLDENLKTNLTKLFAEHSAKYDLSVYSKIEDNLNVFEPNKEHKEVAVKLTPLIERMSDETKDKLIALRNETIEMLVKAEAEYNDRITKNID